jgi:hypothetical protein
MIVEDFNSSKSLESWLDATGWKAEGRAGMFCKAFTFPTVDKWLISVDLERFPVVAVTSSMVEQPQVGRTCLYNTADLDTYSNMLNELQAISLFIEKKSIFIQ